MNFLGSIFGSDGIKKKFVDGIYNSVDAVFYTEEEKKENHKAFLKLYEPFKLGQRYLAIIFGVPYSLLQTLAFSIRLYSWDNKLLQDSITAIQSDMHDSLGPIVYMIVGFYFAGGTIEGGIKAFKSK